MCVEQDRGSIIIPWLSAMFPSADGRNESRRQLAAMTNSFIIYVYSIGVMIISMCALEKRLSLTFQRISVYTVGKLAVNFKPLYFLKCNSLKFSQTPHLSVLFLRAKAGKFGVCTKLFRTTFPTPGAGDANLPQSGMSEQITIWYVSSR